MRWSDAIGAGHIAVREKLHFPASLAAQHGHETKFCREEYEYVMWTTSGSYSQGAGSPFSFSLPAGQQSNKIEGTWVPGL